MHKLPWILALVACNGPDPGGGGTAPPVGGTIDGIALPDADAATFGGHAVDNPFLPLPAGATWTYQAETDEGTERIEVEVTTDAKTVHGVTAVVVRDAAYLDDALIELTDDWYAQDDAGNVWYLGEDTCEYEDGACADTAGSWEWGVDGALPGILMPAEPTVDGRPYFQEYDPGEAEDVGEVIAVDVAVVVPIGALTGCIRTHDTSHLDPAADEVKTWCPGIGTVLTDEADTDELLVATSLAG